MKVAQELLLLATQYYVSPHCYVEPILGMFTKLQKVTISFVMTACLYIHPHGTIRSHWTDFHEI